MKSEQVGNRRVRGDNRRLRRDHPATAFDGDRSVFIFSDFGNCCTCVKFSLMGGNLFSQSTQIFEGVKRGLPRVLQRVLPVTVFERNADGAMHRRAHLADRVEFIIDDFGVGIQGLKQKAVQPPEITVDAVLFLNLLDTVYRGCLTFIKRLGNILASQLDHFRRQVVAQGSEVRGGSGRDTACDLPAIDNNNLFPA
jgi:hypothetical protein